MQNTNTTLSPANVSSVQKDKTVTKALPSTAVSNAVHALAGMRNQENFWQKFRKWVSGFLSGKAQKPQKAEHVMAFSATPESKGMAHQEQAKISAGAVVSAQAEISSPAIRDTLRRIAEQQFLMMDTSQTTRN